MTERLNMTGTHRYVSSKLNAKVKFILFHLKPKHASLTVSLRGGAQAANGVISDRGGGGRGSLPHHNPHPRGRHSDLSLETN